jgi:AcrR family transcriptional regulator
MASTGNRREAIIAAAAGAFDAHGYAATTVDEVAARAGISKGNVYNYFRSKEELFEQVFVAVVAGMETDVLQIFREPLPADEKLKRLLDYRCVSMADSERIGRLVLEFWATAAREQRGHLATTLRQMYDRWREQVAGVLAEGVSQGQFRPEVDVALAAALIAALLDGIEVQSILGFGAELNEQYRNTLKKAVMAALVVDKET